MKKFLSGYTIIYLVFACLYLAWALVTYRNIVFMDMINVIGYQIKHVFGHEWHVSEFIYDPLFPCFTTLMFTYLNAYLFHLNSVVEMVLGFLFLTLAGYLFLSRMGNFIADRRKKFLFAFLIGLLVFGLQKWEATLTCFFSFSVFLNLSICFYSYFFIAKYISPEIYQGKKPRIIFFILANLLFIIDVPPYFYSYILSVIIVLLSAKWFSIVEFDKKRWRTIFFTVLGLFLFTLTMTGILSKTVKPHVVARSGNMPVFLDMIVHQPFWLVKFYLIAQSGPYIGEALDHIGLRAVIGFFILIAYCLALVHVVRRKDKRLLVPAIMIVYNLISYALITAARFEFYDLAYGASSRYTAFNLSGVLGLSTVLFFYLMEQKAGFQRAIAFFSLSGILIGYLRVDRIQLRNSPYRTVVFKAMKKALLTGQELGVLQADSINSMDAIKVLAQYNLNVYYGRPAKGPYQHRLVNIDKGEKVLLVSGSAVFDDLRKKGFYGDENGISWTNGQVFLSLNDSVTVRDSLTMILRTYMPPVCKDIIPKVSILDVDNKELFPAHFSRNGDTFTYVFSDTSLQFKDILISSDTIATGSADKRRLSFPFISLELKK